MVPRGRISMDIRRDVLIGSPLQNDQDDRYPEENFSCQKERNRNSVTEIQDLKTLFSIRAAMAEERLISTCDLSSSSSSFSISSPDSTASSDDITDSGNSSWGFSPPAMPDSNGGPLFHMNSLRASLPSRKRNLSNFFTGKSQSFTCLADVKSVEDLAKPEKKFKSSHSWESTVKSSYNKQTVRSSIFSAGSAESMKISRNASYGSKMGKKNDRSIPTNSYRLPLSPPKQIIQDSCAADNTLIYRSIPKSEC